MEGMATATAAIGVRVERQMAVVSSIVQRPKASKVWRDQSEDLHLQVFFRRIFASVVVSVSVGSPGVHFILE